MPLVKWFVTFQRLVSPWSLKVISLWQKIKQNYPERHRRHTLPHCPEPFTQWHNTASLKTQTLTLCPHYKNQSVNTVQGNNHCSEIHTKRRNTLCGLNVEMLKVKPGSTCYLLLALKWLDTHLSSGNMFSMYHWNGLQSSWFFTSSCSCKLQRETFSTKLCRTFLSGDCVMALYRIT